MIKNKAEHLGKNPQTPQISPWETEPESRVAKPRGPGSKVSGSSCAAENAPLTFLPDAPYTPPNVPPPGDPFLWLQPPLARIF